jgi:hypothetical protein
VTNCGTCRETALWRGHSGLVCRDGGGCWRALALADASRPTLNQKNSRVGGRTIAHPNLIAVFGEESTYKAANGHS